MVCLVHAAHLSAVCSKLKYPHSPRHFGRNTQAALFHQRIQMRLRRVVGSPAEFVCDLSHRRRESVVMYMVLDELEYQCLLICEVVSVHMHSMGEYCTGCQTPLIKI